MSDNLSLSGTANQQTIALAVQKWAAWAPGLTDSRSWHSWANGENTIAGPAQPDVRFVSPMMRRRLSNLGRMAFRTAVDCLDEDEPPTAYVFCSRYGEYNRSFGILKDLAANEPVSPAAFSVSVHNTSASLFAIEMKDTAQINAISGGETTLEAAFIEAWSLLNDDAASTVLLVYHDEPLPDLYRNQKTTVVNSAAFAMLLRRSDTAQTRIGLALSWVQLKHGAKTPHTEIGRFGDPALQVLKLLLKQGEPVVLDTGRLRWTWTANGGGEHDVLA